MGGKLLGRIEGAIHELPSRFPFLFALVAHLKIIFQAFVIHVKCAKDTRRPPRSLCATLCMYACMSGSTAKSQEFIGCCTDSTL